MSNKRISKIKKKPARTGTHSTGAKVAKKRAIKKKAAPAAKKKILKRKTHSTGAKVKKG